MLYIKNQLIDLPGHGLIRVLHVDVETRALWGIEMEGACALPKEFTFTYLADTTSETGINIVNNDPYIPAGSTFVEPKKKYLNYCDQAYLCIKEIVAAVPDIFYPESRAALVSSACERYGITRQTIYKYLRRYWRCGQIPLSLLPQYGNCGAKGVDRHSEVKLGRPRTITRGIGINITPKVLSQMRTAWQRQYLGARRSTLLLAWEWLLKTYYVEHLTYKNDDGDDFTQDDDKVPSFSQFIYWLRKEVNLWQRLRKRIGGHRYLVEHRNLFRNTQSEAFGPGSRYQVDATIVDCYIVSRSDKNRIVGRPTLYLVVDVYTRMIVGFYLGLEPPCWMGARLALINTIIDKVKFCKQYNIEINSCEWPTAVLPNIVLMDRGEGIKPVADLLLKYFSIEIENATAYRGDLKPIVEQGFRQIHKCFGPDLPGYVEQDVEPRLQKDYRLDAKLNIDEIHRIVIYAILKVNNSTRRDYEGEVEMVVDNVPYAPTEMWAWACETNRLNGVYFDKEYVQLHLLHKPKEELKITRYGIQLLPGVYYTSVALLSEPWYEDAKLREESVDVRFHPGDMTSIYVVSKHNQERAIQVSLVDRSARFKGMSLSEINALRKLESANNAAYQPEQRAKIFAYNDGIAATIEDAEKNAREQVDVTLTKKERKASIRDNRREEVADLQRDAARALFTTGVESSVIEEGQLSDDELVEMELIDRLRFKSDQAGRG